MKEEINLSSLRNRIVFPIAALGSFLLGCLGLYLGFYFGSADGFAYGILLLGVSVVFMYSFIFLRLKLTFDYENKVIIYRAFRKHRIKFEEIDSCYKKTKRGGNSFNRRYVISFSNDFYICIKKKNGKVIKIGFNSVRADHIEISEDTKIIVIQKIEEIIANQSGTGAGAPII
jgi:hypothetical protein